MNSRLILLLDEHWPHRDPSADWVLLDGAGRVQQQGRSAPAHWPPAAALSALLAGNQCVWLEVPLPPAPRRDRPRLLAYALEEHLLGDPDAQHLTVTHSEAAGEVRRTGVLAVGRARMNQLVAQFEALGRPLHHLRSLLQAAPADAGHAVLACGPGPHAVLRLNPRHGLALDLPGASTNTETAAADLAAPLQLALAPRPAAQRDGHDDGHRAPSHLELRAAAGSELSPALVSALGTALPLTVAAGTAWPWWSGFDAASELLHDEFASRHDGSRRWRRLRAPLVVAAATAAVLLVTTVVQVMVQRSELARLETRSARLFAEALPGTPAIDPARQLARALDQARNRHGQLGGADLLALLHGHLRATGLPPTALSYDARTLTLRFAPEHAAKAANSSAGLATALATQGIAAQFADGSLRLSVAPRSASTAP